MVHSHETFSQNPNPENPGSNESAQDELSDSYIDVRFDAVTGAVDEEPDEQLRALFEERADMLAHIDDSTQPLLIPLYRENLKRINAEINDFHSRRK